MHFADCAEGKMKTALYVKCENCDENGRDVCVGRVDVNDFESLTDEMAEKILRNIEEQLAAKLHIDPSQCKSEFVSVDTFLEYAGPFAIISAMQEEMRNKQHNNKADCENDEE